MSVITEPRNTIYDEEEQSACQCVVCRLDVFWEVYGSGGTLYYVLRTYIYVYIKKGSNIPPPASFFPKEKYATKEIT